MADSSFFSDLFYVFAQLALIFIDTFLFAVELRYCISWFLNVNPYFEPLFSLWCLTEPVFTLGKDVYPRLFGIQFAALINFRLIGIVQKILDQYVKTSRSNRMHEYYISQIEASNLDLPNLDSILPISLHLNLDFLDNFNNFL